MQVKTYPALAINYAGPHTGEAQITLYQMLEKYGKFAPRQSFKREVDSAQLIKMTIDIELE